MSSSDEDFPEDYIMYCNREDWADVRNIYLILNEINKNQLFFR